MSKYIVDYTEVTFQGMKWKLFNSASEAQAWIEANKETLYWTSLREQDAKSKKAKPVISETDDLSGYIRIEGVLRTYFETGMECMGLILYDTSKHGTPNPNFDYTKPESGRNFRYYSSYDATHFLDQGQILQVEGQERVFLKKDREFAKADGYRLSLYPQGFSYKELATLFFPEKTRATLWIKKESVQ